MSRRKTPKMYILISFIMTMNFAGHCRKGWEDFVGTGDIFVVGDISHKESSFSDLQSCFVQVNVVTKKITEVSNKHPQLL